jgi:hypothetical protein
VRKLLVLASVTVVLAACGAQVGGTRTGSHSGTASASVSAASPTASASPTALALPAASVLLPSFASAQTAAIYGVQEGIFAEHMTHANSSPDIFTSSACTPSAAQPVCLTGGEMTLGTYASYGRFTDGGIGGGAVCFAYVFQDTAGWHSFDSACVQNSVVPEVGQQDIVQVSTCANVHQAPSISAPILTCLADNTQVQVDGGPDYVAPAGQLGTLWWHLKALGWMAHQNLISESVLPCQEPRCALPAASCPATYHNSTMLIGAGVYSKATMYNNFPLPPSTSEVGNSAAGFLASNFCTGGTIEEITAFMDTQLEVHGFHLLGTSGCMGGGSLLTQCWAAGPSDKYGFTYGLSSPASWMAGFRDPDLVG